MRIDAAIFDLDGVVTRTAGVHFAAWRAIFDAFLRERAERGGEPFRPFTFDDYRAHVDGRPREAGVRTFLASRGIELPEGSPDDPAEADTIAGLARRKNEIFRRKLDEMGVVVYDDAVAAARELRRRGVRLGLASSSRNAVPILERAGLDDLFDAIVDGNVSAEMGLRGKPAPDIFLTCLDRLGGGDPGGAMMAEDAGVGVEAGRAGGFGLVVGVDRDGATEALRRHGADLVVNDMRTVLRRLAGPPEPGRGDAG